MEEVKKDLSKWDFLKELQIMAASCVGLKEATAKKKATNLFRKYAVIISHHESSQEYYREEYNRLGKILNTIKTGKISYINKTDNTTGVLLLKQIEQIEVSDKGVTLTTKRGRIIGLGTDFGYLKDLL